MGPAIILPNLLSLSTSFEGPLSPGQRTARSSGAPFVWLLVSILGPFDNVQIPSIRLLKIGGSRDSQTTYDPPHRSVETTQRRFMARESTAPDPSFPRLLQPQGSNHTPSDLPASRPSSTPFRLDEGYSDETKSLPDKELFPPPTNDGMTVPGWLLANSEEERAGESANRCQRRSCAGHGVLVVYDADGSSCFL